MSQAANTFWDERVERVGAAVRERPEAKRRVRARRMVDAIILTIILAATATCFSVYSRARGELDSALAKHAAAGDKLMDLTIKVEKLERDVKQMRTDSRVIELFARQRFGFVRTGDVVIKVSQEPGDSSQAQSPESRDQDGRVSRLSNPSSLFDETKSSFSGSSSSRSSMSGSSLYGPSMSGPSMSGPSLSGRGLSRPGPPRSANLTSRSSDVYTDASN